MSGWQTFCNYWDLFPAYSKYPDLIYGFSCIYFLHSVFCILFNLFAVYSFPISLRRSTLHLCYSALFSHPFYFLSLRLHLLVYWGLPLCGLFFPSPLGGVDFSASSGGSWRLCFTFIPFPFLCILWQKLTKKDFVRLGQTRGLYGMGVLWLFYISLSYSSTGFGEDLCYYSHTCFFVVGGGWFSVFQPFTRGFRRYTSCSIFFASHDGV